MIIVYEAKSSIDANIVQDILSLQNINSHIMGGYLEGGIGEIQTMGVIKLMVEEQDFQQARAVIKQWESQNIDDSIDDQTPLSADIQSVTQQKHKSSLATIVFVGLTIIMLLLLYYFSAQ